MGMKSVRNKKKIFQLLFSVPTPSITDCDVEVDNKINPFFSKLLLVITFATGIERKLTHQRHQEADKLLDSTYKQVNT